MRLALPGQAIGIALLAVSLGLTSSRLPILHAGGGAEQGVAGQCSELDAHSAACLSIATSANAIEGLHSSRMDWLNSRGPSDQSPSYSGPCPNPPPGDPFQRPIVAFAAGWNLVGGPPGWNLFFNPVAGDGYLTYPLYTFQVNDTTYEVISASGSQAGMCTIIPGGVGVWAYFSAPLTERLIAPIAGRSVPLTVSLPPSHWIMIGNPAEVPVNVSGADVVETYDTATGSYQQTTTLQVGQGAWAWSAAGGTLTIAISSS